MKINLSDYTWEEAQDLSGLDPVVLLPLGAFEQHGKHLPLKVDEFMVNNIAKEAVRKSNQKKTNAVVTPVIWSGFSPHHMDFPGTISVQDETLTNLIIDIVESLVKNKLERILILNGHGGNIAILKNVGQKLKYDKNIYIATASYWDFAMQEINDWRESDLGGINHACEMETALMLHMQEDIVKKERIIDNPLKRSAYTGVDLLSGGAVGVSASFKELSDHGVIGSPSLATKEKGTELFETITDKISDFILDFAKWTKPLNGKNE
tara:strand:+ start:1647 stop:2441 length:795 start_codon:yes stop_codon:yes gene_type:complete